MDLKELLKSLKTLKGQMSAFSTSKAVQEQLEEMEKRLLNQIKDGTTSALNPSKADTVPEARGTAFSHLSGEDIEGLAAKMKYILSGNSKFLEKAGIEEKAMASSIGEDGGFMVPEQFINEVLRKLVKISVFPALARTFSGVGLKGSVPAEVGTVALTYEGENVKTTETGKPKLDSVNWGLNKLKGLTDIPMELLRFSAIDVLSLLSTMFSEAFDTNSDIVFMNGSGSNRPLGLRVDVSGMATLAQAGANLDWTDLVDLKHTLPVQYRQGATFIANNDTIAKIAKIRDDDNNPIFLDVALRPGGVAGSDLPPKTVGFILGLPLVEINSIPSDLGSGDKSEIWLTNLKNGYAIFEDGQMEMSSTTEGGDAFEKDQMKVKAIQFHDGKATIKEASAFMSAVK